MLRIEDTNAELATPEYYAAITEPLTALGLDWDEGPFYQSDRGQLHLDAVAQLVAGNAAYFCDCDRDAITARNPQGGYDGHCRDRNVEDGPGVAVRFRAPDEGTTVVNDLIRGDVSFDNAEIEDFAIRRGNGAPVFLVANAVDDADMGITHVVRGEDLLNTTPKVVMLWKALGYGDIPTYAHLPLLVGEDRKKLSKRKDSVALRDYLSAGYLPEAMVNYLALLGWNPGDDREILTIDELIAEFDLTSVNKGAAFFDVKKLEHINGLYIRALSADRLTELADPWLTGDRARWSADRYDAERFVRFLPLIQEKLRTLADIPDYCDFLFVDEVTFDEASWDKAMVNGKLPGEILDGVIAALPDCPWEPDPIKDLVFGIGESLEVNKSKTQAPVRIAVTGRSVGPMLFDAMAFMDRDEVLARLVRARALI